jgi:hypothetical protein
MVKIRLFDVSLIVLFVGSRAGPLDAPVAPQEVGFDKLVEDLIACLRFQPKTSLTSSVIALHPA